MSVNPTSLVLPKPTTSKTYLPFRAPTQPLLPFGLGKALFTDKCGDSVFNDPNIWKEPPASAALSTQTTEEGSDFGWPSMDPSTACTSPVASVFGDRKVENTPVGATPMQVVGGQFKRGKMNPHYNSHQKAIRSHMVHQIQTKVEAYAAANPDSIFHKRTVAKEKVEEEEVVPRMRMTGL